MVKALKTQKVDFALIEFYPNFAVTIVDPSVSFDTQHSKVLAAIFEDYYEGEPYIYLSYRKNDYSVNPLMYSSLVAIKSLKGIGIISENFTRMQIANFEKQFSPIPYELFNSLEEAKAWAAGFNK